MTMTTLTRVQALDTQGLPLVVGDTVRFWLTDWLVWTELGHPLIEVIGQVTAVELDAGQWFVIVDAPFVGPAPWRKPATVVEKVA